MTKNSCSVDFIAEKTGGQSMELAGGERNTFTHYSVKIQSPVSQNVTDAK